MPLPFLVGHGVGEVHLRHRHLPFLDVAVDGGDGHVDAGILHDGVERPLVPKALLEEAVELLVLLLRQVDPDAGGAELVLVLLLRGGGVVAHLRQDAGRVLLRAVEAYEREAVQLLAKDLASPRPRLLRDDSVPLDLLGYRGRVLPHGVGDLLAGRVVGKHVGYGLSVFFVQV